MSFIISNITTQFKENLKESIYIKNNFRLIIYKIFNFNSNSNLYSIFFLIFIKGVY